MKTELLYHEPNSERRKSEVFLIMKEGRLNVKEASAWESSKITNMAKSQERRQHNPDRPLSKLYRPKNPTSYQVNIS